MITVKKIEIPEDGNAVRAGANTMDAVLGVFAEVMRGAGYSTDDQRLQFYSGLVSMLGGYIAGDIGFPAMRVVFEYMATINEPSNSGSSEVH